MHFETTSLRLFKTIETEPVFSSKQFSYRVISPQHYSSKVLRPGHHVTSKGALKFLITCALQSVSNVTDFVGNNWKY